MSKNDTPLSIANIKTNLEEVQKKVAELQSSVASLDSTLTGLTEEADLAGQRLNLRGLARYANGLSSLATQDKILQGILEETRSFVDRAAFFLEFESGYRSWKGFGFTADTLEHLLIEDPSDPVINAAKDRTLIQIEGDLGKKLDWLGSSGGIARNAVCIPLVFKNTVPVIFYGDASSPIDVGTLELLMQLSVLVLQNHYLTHLVQQSQTPAQSRWPVLETRDMAPVSPPEPSPEVTAPPPVPLPVEEAPAEEPVAEEAPPEDDFREESPWVDDAPVETPAEEGLSLEVHLEEGPSDETAPGEQPAETEGAESEAQKEEEIPEITIPELDELERLDSAPVEPEEDEPAAPDPFVAPEEEGPSEDVEQEDVSEEGEERPEDSEADVEKEPETVELTQEEEEHAHAEARRFARLLVTEIKLYNEDAVAEGRESNDLYSRLQADIDRSREMYEKRAHPQIQEKIDYFHEQLIALLAQEEPSRMGPDYPGAQFNDIGDNLHP
ncbi:MAG TPA: hypothetical protein VMY18_07420 [Acidobacteriota bacterium]|nr:hypothetical protein [Acidobacteriota bacterium]